MTPRVSIVLPFRNQAALLAQACQSVRAQTILEWECLLVDDGSASAARAVAEAVSAGDRRFRLLQVPDPDHFPGPWLARNLGLAQSCSELIAFLDADDLWHPEKLERQLALHSEHGIELSVTGYHRFVAGTRKLVETRRPPHSLERSALLRGNPIPLSTVIIHRGWLTQPFRPERHEDYGLWLRLFSRQPPPRYGCLADPLMAYRLHAESLSAQRTRSIFAVEKLFRQELHSPVRRLLAVAGWALERASGLLRAAVRRKLMAQAVLPSPFADYLTQSSARQPK